ncbi:NAD(P)-dependent oxidoreductase [Nocardioides sp. YIM 152588]|uniref:NAD(P)-dependent oxidoreductase n=1 Tax=Nocardioides sp. YIM 152588 TaxID=3158259 RepID=UPI0032E3DA36
MTDTSAKTDLKVGWIGLGSQGGPMARVLAASGKAPVTLWARRPEALAEYADVPVATASTSLGLLMESDVVFLVVRSDDDVREVLLGTEHSRTMGLTHRPPIASMRPGSVVVIHSTIHPALAVELESEAAKYGVGIVDAPVSGGGQAAETRSLLVMTAGDPEVVARVRPLLEVYGDPIPYLGPVGAGQRAKLINNLVLAANMGVAASAFALAKELDVDPENLQVVMSNGSGRSFGVSMVGGDDWDLAGAAQFAGPLLQKDARLLADLAAGVGAKPGVVLDAADSALESMGLPR